MADWEVDASTAVWHLMCIPRSASPQSRPRLPCRRQLTVDYESLDPGIRDVVRKLRANGFETADSGDGISKPAGERVMDFPHVACSVAPDFLFSEADRLQSLLGEEWLVEATYIPSQQSSII